MPDNIFRQAKQLIDKKDRGDELTPEERQLIETAIIPMNLHGCPFPQDITISQGLEELAKIVEEAKRNGTVPRTDQVRAVSHVR